MASTKKLSEWELHFEKLNEKDFNFDDILNRRRRVRFDLLGPKLRKGIREVVNALKGYIRGMK